MSEFAVKLGRTQGAHAEVRIYAGDTPGQRAYAGVLVFRHESAHRFVDALVSAGFDRVADVSTLLDPITSQEEGTHG